jgi:hypothetical protein
LTLGPRVEQEVIFVHQYDEAGNPVSVGRVAEQRKVKVVTVDPKTKKVYETRVDIGGWNVSKPSVPKEEEPKPETKTEEKK